MTAEKAAQAEEAQSDEFAKREPMLIRPYARLLTMLGEQLLKNERVALVELIKNSYDADASRVDVIFEGFGKDMKSEPTSRIVIRDDGCGMTLNTVQKTWMNPATPAKFLDKRHGKRKTAGKKRVVQGEEGNWPFRHAKARSEDHINHEA